MLCHTSGVNGSPSSFVRRKAFVIPLVAWLWAGAFASVRATGGELAIVVTVCFVSGAVWQLLHRRDLADRLTHFSSAFLVMCVFFLPMAWSTEASSSLGTGFGLLAVFAGLVYAEQFLRWREWRSTRRPVPETVSQV